jgi:hypothetical protein
MRPVATLTIVVTLCAAIPTRYNHTPCLEHPLHPCALPSMRTYHVIYHNPTGTTAARHNTCEWRCTKPVPNRASRPLIGHTGSRCAYAFIPSKYHREEDVRPRQERGTLRRLSHRNCSQLHHLRHSSDLTSLIFSAPAPPCHTSGE